MSQASIHSVPRAAYLGAAREGFVIGLALTCALVGVQYVGYALIGVPFVPRDLTLLLPVRSTLLTGAGIILFVLMGGVLAGLYNAIRLRLPRYDLLHGLILGIVAFALTLPLEVAHSWRIMISPVGAAGLLVSYIWWGLALNQSIRGAAARPMTPGDTDSPLLTRRNFVLQTAAGGFLVALLSVPTAWIIESRPIPLPNLTTILSSFVPPPSATPKVHLPDRYF